MSVSFCILSCTGCNRYIYSDCPFLMKVTNFDLSEFLLEVLPHDDNWLGSLLCCPSFPSLVFLLFLFLFWWDFEFFGWKKLVKIGAEVLVSSIILPRTLRS